MPSPKSKPGQRPYRPGRGLNTVHIKHTQEHTKAFHPYTSLPSASDVPDGGVPPLDRLMRKITTTATAPAPSTQRRTISATGRPAFSSPSPGSSRGRRRRRPQSFYPQRTTNPPLSRRNWEAAPPSQRIGRGRRRWFCRRRRRGGGIRRSDLGFHTRHPDIPDINIRAFHIETHAVYGVQMVGDALAFQVRGTAVHLGQVKAHPSLVSRGDEHMLPGVSSVVVFSMKRAVFLQEVFHPPATSLSKKPWHIPNPRCLSRAPR